jgi:hypothetical protein
MQTYRVIDGPVRISAGSVVGLNEAQFHDRRHVVTKNKDGSYTLNQPCDFKTGESFGYDGKLPRGVEAQISVSGSDRTIVETRRAEDREQSEKRAAASLKDFNERNAKAPAKK